jgi:hypothetical protein
MKLVADAHGRLTAAKYFRPGTAFDLSVQADGSYRLCELVEKKNPPAKLVRENGHTLLVSHGRVTLADTQKALEKFP